MAKLSRELKAQGHDIISLSLGEPDFDTPEHIKYAGKKAIDENYTHYTPVPGFLELREAIVAKFKRENQLEFTSDQIVVSTGAKQSLMNLMLALVNPGDEVILPAPYWVSYYEMVKFPEGKPVIVSAGIEQNFKITPQQLREAISNKTKVFIINSPCNPSGSVYTREELEGLVKVLRDYPEIMIISDEIYEHINYVGKHQSIAAFQELKDRIIVVNGLSKGYAMTGWRLGYIGAPIEVAKACDKIQGQFTSGTSAITQRAAIEALSGNNTATEKMVKAFEQRKKLVLKKLGEIQGMKINEPAGAFYIFPDVHVFFGKKHAEGTIQNASDLSMYLLHTAHVAVVTGEAFGAPNCIRISFATSEEVLSIAIDRIKKALDALV